jgi:hypothetical protein
LLSILLINVPTEPSTRAALNRTPFDFLTIFFAILIFLP